MDRTVVERLIGRSLAGTTTFPEILTTLQAEGVDSYHVDFVRNEARYYAANDESLVVTVDLQHGGIAREFSAQELNAVNQRVQAGKATFRDFVREGASAGCAYYIVYVNGRKVRYFGRDGGEHVQLLPGAR